MRRLLAALLVGAGLLAAAPVLAQTGQVVIGATAVPPVAPATASPLYGPIAYSAGFVYGRYAYLYTAAELNLPAGTVVTELGWLKADGLVVTGNNTFDVYLENSARQTIGQANLPWGTISATASRVYHSITQTMTGAAGTYFAVTPTSTFTYTGGNLLVLTDWAGLGTGSGTPQFVTNLGYDYALGRQANASFPFTPATTLVTVYGNRRPTLRIKYGPGPACTSPPTAGTTVAQPAAACPGTPVQLTLSGATYGASQTYQWQESVGSGAFVPIAGATGAAYLVPSVASTRAYRAVLTCGGQTATSAPVTVTATAVAYAPLPVKETFESPWLSICDTRDAPSVSWRSSPPTGPRAWRRDDDGASAGQANLNFGGYAPTGADGSAHSARFHSGELFPGDKGNLDLHVNLNVPGSKVVTFDYINTLSTDSLVVLLSLDGGTTFGPPLIHLNLSGNAAQGWKTYAVQLPAGTNSATAVVRFQARISNQSTGSDIGLDNVALTSEVGPPGCVASPSPANNSTGIPRQPTLTWRGVGSPTSYDLYLGTTPTPPFVANLTTNFYQLPAVAPPNTVYYYQVVPRNANGPAQGCPVLHFTVGGPTVYCAATLGGACSNNILSVVLSGSGLNATGLTCPNVGNGGTFYTSYPATGSLTGTLLRGVGYPLTLVFNNNNSVSAVWVDFNADGAFDASEWTQVSTTSAANQPQTVTLQVPVTAVLGLTGLRIRTRGGTTTVAGPDACTTFGSGETKDFLVTIGPAPSCLPPSNLTVTNLTATGAALGFTTTGPGTYTLVYGPAGFNPATGGTTVSPATAPVAVTGLSGGLTYQFYVTQTCGPGAVSQSAGPFSFTTAITNDEPCGALVLPVANACAAVAGNTTQATTTVPNGYQNPGNAAGSFLCGSAGSPKDVWFKFTTAASGPTSTAVHLAVTGGAASVIRVFSGSSCSGMLTALACSGTSSGVPAPPLDLTMLAPGTTYYVRVSEYSAANFNLGPFTICATPIPNCPPPTALAAAVTPTTANLTWVGALTGASTYTVVYGPPGFDVNTAGTTVTGLTNPSLALTSLLADTDYCFYVRIVCDNLNGTSVNAGPECFHTAVPVPANDEPCGAVGLAATAVNSTNAGASTSVQTGISLPACTSAQTPKDVWFSFVPASTATTLTLTGVPAGMVRVFTAPDCAAGPFAQVFCQAASASNVGFTAPVAVAGLVAGQRYYVAVSGYGSGDAVGGFSISATNLLAARAVADEAVLVYPNPSRTGQLTLHRATAGAAASAQLRNGLGQVVRTVALPGGTAEATLNTQGLAAGVYVLRLTDGPAVSTRRVVLE